VTLDAPAAQAFHGGWAASPSEFWLVGARGVIRHFKDGRWVSEVPFAQGDLLAIWGTGPGDLYVLERRSTGYAVFHHDGRTWTPVEVPYGGAFHALWGSRAALRVGGAGGSILRFRP
jgi:hypothetical protein